MSTFEPRLDILLEAQRRPWPKLAQVPAEFTLYGGTAIALQLGHRQSVDFDFFSDRPFDPGELRRSVPFMTDAFVDRTAYVSDDDLRFALTHAPPGIIDPRSWAYWNSVMGRFLRPPQ